MFRKPEFCPEIARLAVEMRAKVLWRQLGVISQEAARIAQNGGLDVIMDRCIAIELQELLRKGTL